MFRALLVITILCFSSLTSTATFAQSADVDGYLREFHRDPQERMNRTLLHFDPKGLAVHPPALTAGQHREALVYRDQIRADICKSAGRSWNPKKTSQWAAPDAENAIERFFGLGAVNRDLKSMEDLGLLETALAEPPWSDSYWPTNSGLIARRYTDPNFPAAKAWIENYNYWLQAPPERTPANRLSASEKYDLLVGDMQWGLTKANWNDGKRSYDKIGHVPSWAGLCHGWSPAAIMVKQPVRSVTLKSRNGTPVTFHPSDIAALASGLWGNAPIEKRFIGSRCRANRPKQDAVGRVLDSGCFDVNPATWHLAIVNQIGVKRRPFIMDSTYDLQVWNYPVAAYRYSYFNPQSLAVSKSMAGSAVKITDYSIDKFKSYRSPNAAFVVGIAMDVWYTTPIQPSTTATKKPVYHSIKYVYDLELDASGTIIGGEWYSNFHPDFIWMPVEGTRALANEEKLFPPELIWDVNTPVPQQYSDAARGASNRMQPLGNIVERLVQLAQ